MIPILCWDKTWIVVLSKKHRNKKGVPRGTPFLL